MVTKAKPFFLGRRNNGVYEIGRDSSLWSGKRGFAWIMLSVAEIPGPVIHRLFRMKLEPGEVRKITHARMKLEDM